MRGAQVEDGLGRGQVLNVAVLQEGRCGSGRGTVGGEVMGMSGAFILVLYRVLEAVRPEQASLGLSLDLWPLETEILRLEEVLTLGMVMVSLLLPRGVGSETRIRGASRC